MQNNDAGDQNGVGGNAWYRQIIKITIRNIKIITFACKATMPAIKTVLVAMAGNRKLLKKPTKSLKNIAMAAVTASPAAAVKRCGDSPVWLRKR